MRPIVQSEKRQHVRYDVRGPILIAAQRLEPRVQPDFAALERLWSVRSQEIGERIVLGCFPHQSERAVDAAQHWLTDHGEAPKALRRLVIEELVHARRAARARAAATCDHSTAEPARAERG